MVGSYVRYKMEETDCIWLVCEVQNGGNRLHVVGSYVRYRMEETGCMWLVCEVQNGANRLHMVGM